MAMDFSKGKSRTMVEKVMKKAEETDTDNIKLDIDVEKIVLNPDNEEVFGYDDIDYLSENIEDNGFTGTINVYAQDDGTYMISSGHRRFLACLKLGYKKIPCIVSANVNEQEKAKMLILSNIHNRRMTPYRYAKALEFYNERVLKKSHKDSYGQGIKARTELAKTFNMSETTVHRYMSILKLIPEFQKLTNSIEYSFTTIIEAASLSIEEQKELLKLLKEFAEDGDISTVSKTLVKQGINKIKEASALAKQKKDLPKQSFGEVNEMKEESSSEAMIQPPVIEPAFEENENDSNMFSSTQDSEIPVLTQRDENEIDNEVLYYAKKIDDMLLVSYKMKSDNSAKCISILKNILKKLES